MYYADGSAVSVRNLKNGTLIFCFSSTVSSHIWPRQSFVTLYVPLMSIYHKRTVLFMCSYHVLYVKLLYVCLPWLLLLCILSALCIFSGGYRCFLVFFCVFDLMLVCPKCAACIRVPICFAFPGCLFSIYSSPRSNTFPFYCFLFCL